MKVAMILAAGRGERLKPLTDNIPKALCVVKGKPLIEHHVINLAAAGFTKLIINHAYLGGLIRHHLGNGSKWGVEIVYSPEPPGGLETGGGIVNALPLLGNSPFLTVNADIYTDFDFTTVDLKSTSLLHVQLIKKNPALHHNGDFGLVNGNQLCNTPLDYTFMGIACYHPELFVNRPLGRYSMARIIKYYALQKMATASIYQGTWFDIGSIERLNVANNS